MAQRALYEQSPDNYDFSEFERQTPDGLRIYYAAAIEGYEEDFARDALTTGIQTGDKKILLSALESCAEYQSDVYDPITGAWPGSIHHQKPGKPGHDGIHSTEYAAGDTTQLYIIGATYLQYLDPVRGADFIARRKESLRRAIENIESHIEDNLFILAPPPGETTFGLLNITWKDSATHFMDGRVQPDYPAIHTLPHFMAACSLRLGAGIFQEEPEYAAHLAALADAMYRTGIARYIREDGFTICEDRQGMLDEHSTDEAQSLFYIPREYTHLLPVEAIKARATRLATPFGLTCTSPEVAAAIHDGYHGDVVWPHDQVACYMGALMHGLDDVAQTAAGIRGYINEGQELVRIIRDDSGQAINNEPAGNAKQLWARGAGLFFSGYSPLYRENSEAYAQNPSWL